MKTNKTFKTDRISDDLLTLTDLCSRFGISESTVRRRVRNARDGSESFPIPLFPHGCKLVWKRADVEAWGGEGAIEKITFNSASVPPTSQSAQNLNPAQVRRGLEKLGVRFDPSNN